MPFIPLMRSHWRGVIRVIVCAFIAAMSTVLANLAIAHSKRAGRDPDVTL
jgi:hypothetical protein